MKDRRCKRRSFFKRQAETAYRWMVFPKNGRNVQKAARFGAVFLKNLRKGLKFPLRFPNCMAHCGKPQSSGEAASLCLPGRVSMKRREKPADQREKLYGLANGRRILYDQNERIRPYKPDYNDRSEAAHMKKLRAFGLALIVVLSLSGCGALEEGKGGCPPTITLGDQDYVAHNMPVEALPEEYQYLRDLTQQEANDTGLEGCAIYADPQDQDMSTIYLYQECGTPIDENTVDTEQRQWAYVQWVSSGERDETSDPAATEDAGRS